MVLDFTILDERRSTTTAESASVRVLHGHNGHSGIRRGSQVLSPEIYSEDSFQ